MTQNQITPTMPASSTNTMVRKLRKRADWNAISARMRAATEKRKARMLAWEARQ